MLRKKSQILFEKQAEIVQALAHPLRIAIVDFLKDGGQCVCDIAEHIGSERSNVSRHLSLMVNAGLLECRKEGLKVIYNLKTPCISECLECITGLLRQQIKNEQELLKLL